MDARRRQRHFVSVMAKHLPPSASTLRLLDIDGRSGAMLAETRPDISLRRLPAAELPQADLASGSQDAIVAYDIPLCDIPLDAALKALRPGGRFIAVHSRGRVSENLGRTLEKNGFVRILVEPALDDLGILIRGEKPHVSAQTAARIRAVADADGNALTLESYRGRFVHLLIQQRPSKPAWQLEANESLTWRAAAIEKDGQTFLLGYSSLPKAVAFMQPAVLAGLIRDVNKVAKFNLATARAWPWGLLLNPSLAALQGADLIYLTIDPASAEAPDE